VDVTSHRVYMLESSTLGPEFVEIAILKFFSKPFMNEMVAHHTTVIR